MRLTLNKALFLSYLLTVALSREAPPPDLNATASRPPCDGLGGATECLIAYRQPELELVAGSNGYDIYKNLHPGPADCDRGKPYKSCLPPQNPTPKCDFFNRNYPHC
ncbi:hypothetical protein ACJRO7_035561 [Eucalyptus globulus]|uniref:Uncharacterized protein n=1 Tax=Eucalyptus globulus TaxID=34317 RepID=A0ABD3J993_EUCGL